MRNPDRITPTLAALEAAWRAHPDWRLGQLIVNACPRGAGACPQIFYPEDDQWLAMFEHFEKHP